MTVAPVSAAVPDVLAQARVLLVHLRLPFQLLLAPVFLCGWLLAGGGLSGSVLLAFVTFHVFLYGGSTAFNSAFDRDEGPVGGLERPPPVPDALLPFSLVVKGVGWLLSAVVNPTFSVLYGAFVLLSVAYSHPRIRLKARPVASLLVVGVGQGALAFLAAWAAVRGDLQSAWNPVGLAGASAATLLILGVFPLSQVFQVEEDRARGDRTPAVAWGVRRSFGLALAFQALGGVVLLAIVASRYGGLEAALVGAGLLVEAAAVVRWAATFDASDVLGRYRRAMRLNTLSAAGLFAYFLWHLAT